MLYVPELGTSAFGSCVPRIGSLYLLWIINVVNWFEYFISPARGQGRFEIRCFSSAVERTELCVLCDRNIKKKRNLRLRLCIEHRVKQMESPQTERWGVYFHQAWTLISSILLRYVEGEEHFIALYHRKRVTLSLCMPRTTRGHPTTRWVFILNITIFETSTHTW